MKILKTIRIDPSDLNVFNTPAKVGEIAVTGTFVFSDISYADLDQKEKLAFQSAWMGIGSFGYSTLVEVCEVEMTDLDQAVEKLAVYFVNKFGAPSIAAAIPVAQAELDYAASLCEFDEGTILAIVREESEGGIKESIRKIVPHPQMATNEVTAFEMVADDTEGSEQV